MVHTFLVVFCDIGQYRKNLCCDIGLSSYFYILLTYVEIFQSWLMDGLYEIRYGTGDSAPVETDDFWSKINAFLDTGATVSSGSRDGLLALNLDADSCTATPEEWDHIEHLFFEID